MNHNFYNQHLLNDIDTTGDTVRRKNKLKESNMMSMSVSFLDKSTLEKIREVFTSLSPEEMEGLKSFLNNKEFLRRSSTSESKKIIQKITKIALTSTPKDEKLKKIKDKFNSNLEKIDKVKVLLNTSKDNKEIGKLCFFLEKLHEQNMQLFEEINNYREEVFAQ